MDESLLTSYQELEQLVSNLVVNGQFYYSAIELDKYEDSFVDGESLLDSMLEILNKIDSHK